VTTTADILIRHDQPIPTWFRVGGRADRMARPRSVDELRRCLEIDPALRILGDGANLLVSDEGVGELVVAMDDEGMRAVEIDADAGRVTAMGGARLPQIITSCVRVGLGGMEGLAGIPASLGGAVLMNAGGAFGQIADVVERVWVLDRDGHEIPVEREQIRFGYRRSGLGEHIITRIELRLDHADADALAERRLEVMRYKKTTQPMADRSAGCAFRNPILVSDLEGIGTAGERVSAGLLIDRAGGKGMCVGGARVSDMHANFIVTGESATASDVVSLMVEVAGLVHDKLGVKLTPEVVIWRREP